MLFFQGAMITPKVRLSKIHAFSANYVYFADIDSTISDSEIAKLEKILPQAKLGNPPANLEYLTLWVVPRTGTISAWSSKATDIAKICDLKAIKRLERGIYYQIYALPPYSHVKTDLLIALKAQLHDPLIESILTHENEFEKIFLEQKPRPLIIIDILQHGIKALHDVNAAMGLALSEHEMQYLVRVFKQLNRNPSDAELMMFAQVNSEHCRHKIFNARWQVDGKEQDRSLFSMIRHTFESNPNQTLVAYKDNAAIMKGNEANHFVIDPHSKEYLVKNTRLDLVFKVETHNHPTAISPFPGAATGSGGEIRDEAATGRGAKPKMGLAGFSVSHLHIPNFRQPWEFEAIKINHMASALEIMLDAPIGAASFNNEFGRPNLCGYFRTFLMKDFSNTETEYRGYHKPIMLAGGVGNIIESSHYKIEIPVGAKLIVLGGPAMAIGLGGGSASSLASGKSNEELDFASVQRSNPEMERRAQEVINSCWALAQENPILSIHDVGAGGLSNALPELVAACKRGAKICLRKIPNAALSMSPKEIWCNEAQERYVLAIKPDKLDVFERIAKRERAIFAVVGEATEQAEIVVEDEYFHNKPIELPNAILFEDMPKLQFSVGARREQKMALSLDEIDLVEAARRVLQYPTVADKSFLITIGDRSVTGLVARDQMVGPWQVPVADVAVTASDYEGYCGEALAIGERAPVALIDAPASARLAVGEAITNIAAAWIGDIKQITLSANWMAAAGIEKEQAALYEAVYAVAMELCPKLGINIPVGKDSLSMRSVWQEEGRSFAVISPLSLIITAAAPVRDVRYTVTPQLKTDVGSTKLLWIDLSREHPLGGSILAQAYQMIGAVPADLKKPDLLIHFFNTIQALIAKNLLLAYHDRSDGGLFVTLCEMCFAGHTGIRVDLPIVDEHPLAVLFSEGLGAVIQIKTDDIDIVMQVIRENNLHDCVSVLGEPTDCHEIDIYQNKKRIYCEKRVSLHRLWSETSFRLQALRDNPDCAQQEYARLFDEDDPGLSAKLTFNINEDICAPFIKKTKPQVAILREQGVNGHMEMAAAFTRAGFHCVDVHMCDLLDDRINLKTFQGLAACGGFSYGDVLGAGRGWAQSILWHEKVRENFAKFFERHNTFALGVCNGCQMFSQLKEIIPGSEYWPYFRRNLSDQFEARVALVEVMQSSSIFFQGMHGSIMPIAIAHGEGRAEFNKNQDLQMLNQQQLVALRYVDNRHQHTEAYPANPNGSPQGITALTSSDGRVTIMMPHPERVFRTIQNSWHPCDWKESAPFLRMFRNARKWLE